MGARHSRLAKPMKYGKADEISLPRAMESGSQNFFSVGQAVEDIGEPPPLARISSKRSTSRSPQQTLYANTTYGPERQAKWWPQPEKRVHREDDSFPSKHALYAVSHQVSSPPSELYARRPAAEANRRVDVGQQLAAASHLQFVGQSPLSRARPYSRATLADGYDRPVIAETCSPASNAAGAYALGYVYGENGPVGLVRCPNNEQLTESQLSESGRRWHDRGLCASTPMEHMEDPSQSTGELLVAPYASGKWPCMRRASTPTTCRQWLPDVHKPVAENAVVPGPIILSEHQGQLVQHSHDEQFCVPGDRPTPQSMRTNEKYLSGEMKRLVDEQLERIHKVSHRTNGTNSSISEADMDPLKALCHRVLVEERSDEEGLHTLTAILLQAIELARPLVDKKKHSTMNNIGSSDINHVLGINHGVWGRSSNPDCHERQLAMSHLQGPIDIEDGIQPEKANAYQALVHDDPALRPLPEEEEGNSGESTHYWCRSCRVAFKWRRHLEHHFLSHRTNERSSVCHICGKCFTRGDHLNRHASMHNLTEYTCQLCGQRFVRASHLEMHWGSDHSDYVRQIPSVDRQPEVLSMPSGCTFLVPDKGPLLFHHPPNGLTFHQNSDALSDNSGCSPNGLQASKRFLDTPPGSPDSLHEYGGRYGNNPRTSPAAHSDQGSVEITEKAIQQLPAVPIGCGPRPYRCQVCARAFNRLAHLQRHHRVHLGEKPLRCSLCSRSYSTAEQLRSHVISQHDNNVINCKTCGKEFSTMGALTNHQKVHQREQNRAESALMARSFDQQ